MKRVLTLAACIAAATLTTRADDVPEVVVCPVYLPDGTAGPITYGPSKGWYTVDPLERTFDLETFDIDETLSGDEGLDPIICIFPGVGEPFDELHPYDRYIDPIFAEFAEIGANISWVVGSSADGNIILAYDHESNPVVVDLLARDVQIIPMAARSLFADPDEFVTADMIPLTATAISADGSTVVGDAYDAAGVWRLRRADGNGVTALELPHSTWSGGSAIATSANGDVVIGYATRVEGGNFHAVSWNAAGNLTQLNPLQSDDVGSIASFVTPDGSVVAGDYFSNVGSGVVPFIWNQTEGFTALGDPLASDDQVLVNSLSDDGLVLSGNRFDAAGITSWYWTKETGFVDLEKLDGYEEDLSYVTGVDVDSGIVYGCFADGGYFLRSNEGIINPQEWVTSLNCPIGSTAAAFMLSSQPMEGAHHRPLSEYAIPGKDSFAWVTGDYGIATRSQDLRQGAGEIGYGFRVGKDGVIGFSGGYYDQSQDFALGGTGDSTGRYLVVEAGFGLGWGQASFTALAGNTKVDTVRGYTVGLGTDYSSGYTEGRSYAFRARLDGQAFGTIAGSTLSPFVSVTFDRTELDGYAETGGAFPAIFNDRSDDRIVTRLGLVARTKLGASDTLRTSLEVAHNSSGAAAPVTGTDTATGLVDFSVPGTSDRSTWARLGLDLDHQIDPVTVLNLTVQGSTRGDAFDLAFAVSLRRGF
ncbi:MAG: autotransporter domain-containing protein [Opitutales bacterium]